jgi:hypothetical protein
MSRATASIMPTICFMSTAPRHPQHAVADHPANGSTLQSGGGPAPRRCGRGPRGLRVPARGRGCGAARWTGRGSDSTSVGSQPTSASEVATYFRRAPLPRSGPVAESWRCRTGRAAGRSRSHSRSGRLVMAPTLGRAARRNLATLAAGRSFMFFTHRSGLRWLNEPREARRGRDRRVDSDRDRDRPLAAHVTTASAGTTPRPPHRRRRAVRDVHGHGRLPVRRPFDQCGIIVHQDADNGSRPPWRTTTSASLAAWSPTAAGRTGRRPSHPTPTRSPGGSRAGNATSPPRLGAPGGRVPAVKGLPPGGGDRAVDLGVYACSPVDGSFTATFTEISLGECVWQAHTPRRQLSIIVPAMKSAYAGRSSWPLPETPIRMTPLLPRLGGLARGTERSGDRVVRLGRGDDRSERAKMTPASNASRCYHEIALIRPSWYAWLDERSLPWYRRPPACTAAGDEVRPQRVHLEQRSEAAVVPEVVPVLPPR